MANVMTAPRAIVKVNGQTIGLIRNIRVTETVQLGDVQGLGSLTTVELPALSIKCNCQIDFFFVNLQKSTIPGLDVRDVQTVNDYVNTLLFGDAPVDIYIYKKESAVPPGTRIVTEVTDDDFVVIRDLHLESTSFDISEGQVSGRNISARYLNPIISPV